MTILSLPTTIDRAYTVRFTGILDHQEIAYCELALTNAQAHVATLYSVYMNPAHRGKGNAQHLVSAAIAAAQERGKTAVNLRRGGYKRCEPLQTSRFAQYEGRVFIAGPVALMGICWVGKD
jgi:GNAT superfamily N-acetyltransferase